jgi:hypothetical protein
MSSGSSGYDPKYTSLDLSAQADGERYRVAQQEQQEKKGKQEKDDTLLKETSEAPSKNSKIEPSTSEKVSHSPYLDLCGCLLTLAVEMHNVISVTAITADLSQSGIQCDDPTW